MAPIVAVNHPPRSNRTVSYAAQIGSRPKASLRSCSSFSALAKDVNGALQPGPEYPNDAAGPPPMPTLPPKSKPEPSAPGEVDEDGEYADQPPGLVGPPNMRARLSVPTVRRLAPLPLEPDVDVG
jgi:hypothetical protein